MKREERYKAVIEYFEKAMPVAESELNFENPYQLLVAVILSAQCTDKRVNLTTPALFEAYPTPFDLAKASPEEIYQYIKSISRRVQILSPPTPPVPMRCAWPSMA